MKNPRKTLSNFSFVFKTGNEIEKDLALRKDIHKLAISVYPAGVEYFEKNEWYSTVKPQLALVVHSEGRLAGYGKLLWKSVSVNKRKIKMGVIGILINKEYQGMGVGKKMLDKQIKRAKDEGIDVVYGATRNPIVTHLFTQKGFQRFTADLIYEDAITAKDVRETSNAFGFELKKGLMDEINKLSKFNLGVGPL